MHFALEVCRYPIAIWCSLRKWVIIRDKTLDFITAKFIRGVFCYSAVAFYRYISPKEDAVDTRTILHWLALRSRLSSSALLHFDRSTSARTPFLVSCDSERRSDAKALINQSINHSIDQSINRSSNHSIDQSINQSSNHFIDQSIHQSWVPEPAGRIVRRRMTAQTRRQSENGIKERNYSRFQQFSVRFFSKRVFCLYKFDFSTDHILGSVWRPFSPSAAIVVPDARNETRSKCPRRRTDVKKHRLALDVTKTGSLWLLIVNVTELNLFIHSFITVANPTTNRTPQTKKSKPTVV